MCLVSKTLHISFRLPTTWANPLINNSMYRPTTPISQPFPQKVIRKFDAQIKPNVYAVGHLKTHLWDSDLRLGQPGTFEAYDMEAYKLMANVSKRLLGRTAYRKRHPCRKRLPNFVTLEGFGDCPHLNILIHKAERFSFEELESALRDEWMRLDWTVKEPRAFWIERRVGNCVSYSFKEGNEALLQRSLCFHR